MAVPNMGPMARQNLEVINAAVALQVDTLSYIKEQFAVGPYIGSPEEMTYSDFMEDLERCNHNFDGPCNCEACQRHARFLLGVLDQIQQQPQAEE